jgi:hypothetical protein
MKAVRLHARGGVVAGVGRGVTAPPLGEAVYGLNDWFRDGAQAEYCVARADEVGVGTGIDDNCATLLR